MRKSLYIICALLAIAYHAIAQDGRPTINPTAVYTNAKGEVKDSTEYSAPITGRYEANATNVDSWDAYYEWRFTKEGEDTTEPFLIRYEENTEYTFTESGAYIIELYAIFTQGNDSAIFTEEYWSTEGEALRVTVCGSKLEMPNAFSPNGDNHNDIYRAKRDTYQSLVEFHAIIFNRWGQKLFEWYDPAEGWDGTYNGKPVKEGVYFVDVRAKGADGRNYHIRRDVNLLRNHTESAGSSSSSTGNE